MAKLFKLPGPGKDDNGKETKPPFSLKGKVAVAGSVFEDGQCLILNDDDAALKAPVLTRFYGCTMEDVAVKAEEVDKGEGSLAANETKK